MNVISRIALYLEKFKGTLLREIGLVLVDFFKRREFLFDLFETLIIMQPLKFVLKIITRGVTLFVHREVRLFRSTLLLLILAGHWFEGRGFGVEFLFEAVIHYYSLILAVNLINMQFQEQTVFS